MCTIWVIRDTCPTWIWKQFYIFDENILFTYQSFSSRWDLTKLRDQIVSKISYLYVFLTTTEDNLLDSLLWCTRVGDDRFCINACQNTARQKDLIFAEIFAFYLYMHKTCNPSWPRVSCANAHRRCQCTWSLLWRGTFFLSPQLPLVCGGIGAHTWIVHRCCCSWDLFAFSTTFSNAVAWWEAPFEWYDLEQAVS